MSVELARGCADALETLKDLDGEPSVQQVETLRGWAGWGPLAPALERAPADGAWAGLGQRVKGLLTQSEEISAKEATATAFYTVPAVARAMWTLMAKLEFAGGRVLDPGCGTMVHADTVPPGMDVQFTGVEMDPVTAAIAKVLHPEHTVINAPLQRTALRIGGHHAVIGNVPFANVEVYDAAWPDTAGFKPNLHNYFIWRAIQATAPGGIICLITSRYTMDASWKQARRFFSRDATFIGAVRFPTRMFAAAGTGVVCDLLVLRRRTGDEPAELLAEQEAAWSTATEHPELVPEKYRHIGNQKVHLNTYWDTHPDMVLGTFASRGGAQYGHTIDVVPPPGADPVAMLSRAVNAIADDAHRMGLLHAPEAGPSIPDSEQDFGAADREGAHDLHPDGTVTRIQDGQQVKVRGASAELKQLILLRDAATALFDAEGDADTPDETIRPLREHARHLYEQYVAAFGPLNRSVLRNGKPDAETGLPTVVRATPSLGGIRIDPDWPTLSAVEDWDDDTERARPAAILLRRVNTPIKRKTHADSPAEAVALCVDEIGSFDLTRAADLLGVETLTEAAEKLSGLVWQDPATLEWEAAEEYLSGDVRVKLTQARKAAEADPHRWGPNVAALEAVQPDDLGPAEILVKLGAPWLPAGDVALFVRHLLQLADNQVKVTHEPFTASWDLWVGAGVRQHPAAYVTWGTRRVGAVELISQALNGAAPAVYDKHGVPDPDRPGRTKEIRVRNSAETLLAEDKQRAIQDEFVSWLWSDPGRTDRLVRIYNDLYNAIRLRVFNGAGFTFPGLVAPPMYDHQRDMIARIVQTKNAATLCGFGVGAGKTLIMIAAALKMKELGLVRKPVVIVPNHLLEQVAGDARRHYPGARVLMVTKKDLTKDRRKAFAAKVAANDWDVIVMTHTQFLALPVSPHVEASYLEDLILQYEQAMVAAADDDDARVVKRLGKQITRLKERHARLMDARHDGGLFFDRIGIDFVFADEAHFFKNLAAPTRMEGFSMPGSKRAEDFHMKLEWLRTVNTDGRCAAMFSGTPVTNTLAEVFTLLRYQDPALLRRMGLSSFDAFAGLYIVYETQIEVSPDGAGFRLYRRPRRFQNVPELRLLLASNADIRSRKKLGLAGPKNVVRRLEEVQPPPELAGIVEDLVARADAIRAGTVKPDEDNMLAVCGEGRLAALDVRLVGVNPSTPGKPERVAENVATLYHLHKNRLYPSLDDDGTLWMARPGGFQMVFCDLGTPGTEKGDQAYGWMRAEMLARGVPADKIAYIHDAHTDAERKQLFAACRDGRIAVLIASTPKAGTGVNVQHRMVAIHHVDITWRPDEMEQRDGRGNRPGNTNETLVIFVYVTVGSFDPYMLQGLERKMRMIDQITDGDPSVREIIDVPSEQEQYFGMLKAVSTGQERVMELERLKADAARLLNAAAGHSREQTRLANDHDHLTRMAWAARDNARHLEGIAAQAEGMPPVLHLWRNDITDVKDIAEYLGEKARAVVAGKHTVQVGEWRGVTVSLHNSYINNKPAPAFGLTPPGHYKALPFPPVRDGHRPAGTLRLLKEIDNAVAGAAAGAAAEQDRAAYLLAEADELKPMLHQPFPQQAELDAAVTARDALAAEIEAEVDKQASRKAAGQVPAAA